MKEEISAIITIYNEDKYLEKCLSSLSFCEEIFAIDLGSKDRSVAIAKKYVTKIINSNKIFQVEKVHEKFASLLKNDWLLITDPDEILPSGLDELILTTIKNNPDLSQINTPIQYYFKGKKLKGTIWGGKKYRKIIINRKKVDFVSRVHRGIVFKDRKPKIINLDTDLLIKHYWVDSYKELFDKHCRYLLLEGQSRYDFGERYSFIKKIKESARAFYDGLIKNQGFYSFDEMFLCFFYAWYVWCSNNSLKKYEEQFK